MADVVVLSYGHDQPGVAMDGQRGLKYVLVYKHCPHVVVGCNALYCAVLVTCNSQSGFWSPEPGADGRETESADHNLYITASASLLLSLLCSRDCLTDHAT